MAVMVSGGDSGSGEPKNWSRIERVRVRETRCHLVEWLVDNVTAIKCFIETLISIRLH